MTINEFFVQFADFNEAELAQLNALAKQEQTKQFKPRCISISCAVSVFRPDDLSG